MISEASRSLTAQELYLDLMKRCLTRSLFRDASVRPMTRAEKLRGSIANALRACAAPIYLRLLRARAMRSVAAAIEAPLRRVFVRLAPPGPQALDEGTVWPDDAETMIGRKRLDNIQQCVTDVLRSNVPGDLAEAGVWRGGAVIFMRAILEAYGDRSRCVWAADSFRGLPPPDPARAPADRGDVLFAFRELAISLDIVRENFKRYGLLDDRVKFLVGWFKDTLPAAPIARLAVLRIDGDLYESTMDALRALYPKLSTGGYVIVDDYGNLPGCRAAVEDYRREFAISEPIEAVDWTAIYWRKSAG
jgi:O-methyltransferase